MILRDAQGVRAALQLAAAVDTLAGTFAQLKTDLLGFAVKIVRAVTVLLAATLRVSWVATVARRTDTRSILADRARATLDAATFINARASDASIVDRAGELGTARARGWVFTRDMLHLLTADERIAKVTVFAAAVIAADRVNTHCIVAACVSVTLVNVCSLGGTEKN